MDSLIALLILHSFFVNKLCYATDTIAQNKILRDGDTIVSNGGNFTLGFFSPGNSKLRYVGIWYSEISKQTVVWVANRNNPINSSSLGVGAKVDERGNLGIFNGNSSYPVWSTDISVPISDNINSKFFYKIFDTGNLVLREESRGDILWQSFDFPTDTGLPGMKLGLNLKSWWNWSLTSWKSRGDPSTGEFTYNFDLTVPRPPELYIKTGSKKIWRTGLWNGVPKMSNNHSFVNNPDEIYIIVCTYNTSVFSRLYLDELGILRRLNWVEDTQTWTNIWSAPLDSCDYYGKCGAFASCNSNNADSCPCLSGFQSKSTWDWYLKDTSQGCVRKRELLCGKGDGFLRLEKIKLPDTSNARVYISLGTKDCEIECRTTVLVLGILVQMLMGVVAWFGLET
ncbi:hypothetical protein Sjap_025416 [Stephania japonica]|uniref:Bulb-type lectin domain-containing protein n=1 Tax=Stephania japonica TaxID=461633 RepID=A0AAP0HJJ9_9MAGN